MPHWERIHRCWGYWEGLTRLAFVGQSHPAQKPVTYGWSIDDGKGVGGRVNSLKQAKQAVEKALATATGQQEGTNNGIY